jgi:hypothetical protein
MIAQVQKAVNDEKLFTVRDIGEMGFDFALFGVGPIQCVVGALEFATRDFLGGKESSHSKPSRSVMVDFATVKEVVGFGALEDFERKFPCT